MFDDSYRFPSAVPGPRSIIEHRLADPRLAADLGDRRSFLRLPQYESDLLLTEPGLLHPQSPPRPGQLNLEFPAFKRSSFPGAGHMAELCFFSTIRGIHSPHVFSP